MSPLERAVQEYEVAHEAYMDALQAKETTHGHQSHSRQDVDALYKAVVRAERRLQRLQGGRGAALNPPRKITFKRC